MKINIIVPCYNSSKTVNNLIKAFNNSSKKIKTSCQIIFIDDGSSDNTVEVINKNFELKYNYTKKIIKLSENKGVSYARNIGIKNSNAEYIAFFDSDDLPSNNYFEIIEEAIENNKNYYIYTFAFKINGKKILLRNSEDRVKSYLNKHYFCTNSIIVSSQIKEKVYFRNEFVAGEDEDLWLRLICNYDSLHSNSILCEYLFNFKIHKLDKHPVFMSIDEKIIPEKYTSIIKSRFNDRIAISEVWYKKTKIFKNIVKNNISLKAKIQLSIIFLCGRQFYELLTKFKK